MIITTTRHVLNNSELLRMICVTISQMYNLSRLEAQQLQSLEQSQAFQIYKKLLTNRKEVAESQVWNHKDERVKLDAIIERNAYEDALNIHIVSIKEFLDRKRIEEIEREEFMDS